METATVISLSVLSTLAVVAIIILIIFSFSKLCNRVDTMEETLSNSINNDRRDFNLKLENKNIEFSKQLKELKSELDSRCDKLYTKINISPTTHLVNTKQILQG